MTMVPPSPWKTATTRTMLFTIVVVAVLASVFVYVVAKAFSDADRPVTEQEREQIWKHQLERAQGR